MRGDIYIESYRFYFLWLRVVFVLNGSNILVMNYRYEYGNVCRVRKE